MSAGSPSSGWPVPPRNPDSVRSDYLRRALTTLEGFIAICAIAGGMGLVSGELAMPTEWLGQTFETYRIPGLILAIVVGGTMAAAGRVVWTDRRYARDASLGAGLVLIGWLFFQVVIIGYQSWLQPMFFLLGLIIVILGRQLPIR
jgi:hypothetical protein